MPRPSLGAKARTKVVSIRVNEEEEAILIEKYGTTTKGLRALITAEVIRSKGKKK